MTGRNAGREGKPKCPICGDARPYIFWMDPEPPEGCPDDESWQQGGPVTIKNVTECRRQMVQAAQAAELRKLTPDAFDEGGMMLPGQSARAWGAYIAAHPSRKVAL